MNVNLIHYRLKFPKLEYIIPFKLVDSRLGGEFAWKTYPYSFKMGLPPWICVIYSAYGLLTFFYCFSSYCSNCCNENHYHNSGPRVTSLSFEGAL